MKPAPHPPGNMIIRPETAQDVAAIREINAQAFQRDNEARLIEAVRTTPEFNPDLSLVAVEDGRSIGYILFSAIQIRTPEGALPALALAPLAVRPEMQNRGVGSALVRAGLEACRRHGHRIVVVLGHPHYYPRFGFSLASAHGIGAPFALPDAAFMVLELAGGALHDVRGMVVYPPAFAAV